MFKEVPGRTEVQPAPQLQVEHQEPQGQAPVQKVKTQPTIKENYVKVNGLPPGITYLKFYIFGNGKMSSFSLNYDIL